jgi:hypothetical protein
MLLDAPERRDATGGANEGGEWGEQGARGEQNA